MRTRVLLGSIKCGVIASIVAATVGAAADQPARPGVMQTATGQYVTPTAVSGAVQQFLNPGLRGVSRLRGR